jgi:hypothetical protein
MLGVSITSHRAPVRARSMADTPKRAPRPSRMDGQSFGQYVKLHRPCHRRRSCPQVRPDNRDRRHTTSTSYSQWTLGDAVGQIDWLIHQWQESEVKVS